MFSNRIRTILYLQLQNVGHCVGECRSEWRGRQNANSSTWIFKFIPLLKLKRLTYLFKHKKLFLLLKLTQLFWLLASWLSWKHCVLPHLRAVFVKDLLTSASLAASRLHHCWGNTSFPMGKGSREESGVHH